MTKMASASESAVALLATINSKDALQSLTMIQQFRESMKDSTLGADYVSWIIEPVNLTSVQKALADDLNVPHRLLMIRRMLMSRTQKAVMLLQAMENAIKKVHNL